MNAIPHNHSNLWRNRGLLTPNSIPFSELILCLAGAISSCGLDGNGVSDS